MFIYNIVKVFYLQDIIKVKKKYYKDFVENFKKKMFFLYLQYCINEIY